ncbi:MAG: GHKL domain-containing protein [Bacteroidetes bacterium]|nr:MAG: GHKL domain-containing protein [Bacteroidota bacterium]
MSVSPLSSSRVRIFFGIVWLVIIGDHTALMIWYGCSFEIAIIDALVSTIHLLLASLLLLNTLRYYMPQKERFIHLFAWCVFLTAIIIILTRLELTGLLIHNHGYSEFFDRSVVIRISLYFLFIGCIALMSVIWYNRVEQDERGKRKQDLEKLAKDAELFKLRQQLQPHFLFNSLNSINALIGVRPAEARKMVQQLSDFLRGTLKKEEQQWVNLKEEMQYLQLYLDIEKVRFGNRLSTVVNTDESAENLKLPALLLQPIVENAIKFGLYDTMGETIIIISAKNEDNKLIVEVQNPFDPETSAPQQGTGFGLKSVQRRLFLLFARNDLLKTTAKENIFTTTVTIPQHV